MDFKRYYCLILLTSFLVLWAPSLSAQPAAVSVSADTTSPAIVFGNASAAEYVRTLQTPRDTVVVTKTTSLMADAQLLLDDGNNSADIFLGNNGNSEFYWSNTYVLLSGFDLRSVRFYMRTENVSDLQISIDIINGRGDLLFHSLATLSSSPTGSFYDAPLPASNLYSFAAGQIFTIIIGAPSSVRSPAGTDIEGTIRNNSRFSIDLTQGFVNLNTQTDQNLTNGAFLIRALGDLKVPNEAPTAAHPVDDLTLTLGEDPLAVNLNNVFSDTDGDRLYYASWSIDPDIVRVSTHDNTLTLTNVTPGRTRIYVSANDGKGGIAIDDAFATVNNLPPDIGHTAVSTAVSGEPIEISASINDASGVNNATLLYRRGGEANFSSVALNLTGETYSSTIPGNAVTSRGIQYRLRARDSQNLTGETGLYSVSVQVGDEDVSNPVPASGKGENAYRLISVPVNLNSKHPRDVLADDLLPYDDTKWRFFGLRADQSYIEFPNTAPMSPGIAFWLAVAESGKTIDTGPGSSVSLAQPFGISLNAGWNFIGNPFNFDVPVGSIHLESEQALDIRSFNGSWAQHNGAIRPFQGYAVFADANDRLLVSPYVSVVDASKTVAGFDDSSFGWSIRILAHTLQIRDIDNIAAVAVDALPAWDDLDRPEPPVIGDYVTVSFPHPEWDAPVSSFSTDVRPEPYDSEAWTFNVKSNIHDTIELIFENVEEVPPQFEVWLVDESLHIAQDLRLRNHYFLVGPLDLHPKQLKLIVGHHDIIEEAIRENLETPSDYTLRNYPNPFNPATTIHFGLPDEQRVTITVYNLLGEKIATLVDGEVKVPGHHTVIWDGQNEAGHAVASGLYIYQLRGSSITLTKTMMLVK